MTAQNGVSTYNLSARRAENVTVNGSDGVVADLTQLIPISTLFFLIGLAGVMGNVLVIFAVLLDRKMRRSVTNQLITNLAVADLFIMVFGVPEVVQFMLNEGWQLGDFLCRMDRYILVSTLYASVFTLVALCIERYIAIIRPIKAHVLCSPSRSVIIISLIWLFSMLAGLPTLLFNRLVTGKPGSTIQFCVISFPIDHRTFYLVFKYIELSLFYLIPMLLQIVLYAIIAKQLFLGSDQLHRRFPVRSENGCDREKASDAIKSRQGVVKMLIASVVIYFISYSPPQIMLLYETLSTNHFQETWPYVAFVMVVAYINSAASPILYGIFSQNFRKRFKHLTCCLCCVDSLRGRRQSTFSTSGSRMFRLTSFKSAQTEI